MPSHVSCRMPTLISGWVAALRGRLLREARSLAKRAFSWSCSGVVRASPAAVNPPPPPPPHTHTHTYTRARAIAHTCNYFYTMVLTTL